MNIIQISKNPLKVDELKFLMVHEKDFFNDDSEYDSTMNFLIHFVNYDFYDKDNNLIPKKDLIMYDVDLLKRKFNFNNNAGIAPLEIVTPFV